MSKKKWNNYKSRTNEKRTEIVSVRLSKSEVQEIKNNAEICGMSMSEFMLNVMKKIDFTQTLAFKNEFKNVFQELVRVDTNFNQAVKNLNISMSDKVSSNIKEQRFNEFEEVLFGEHEERQNAYKLLSQLLQKMLMEKA